MGSRGTLRGAALAVALIATGTAQAEDRCWPKAEATAASIRTMQTMLMVTTLRCRAAGIDIVADYDGFVTAKGEAIAAANAAIRNHFGGQAEYDRFATSLANGFGDDATTDASCAHAAELARAAAGTARLEAIAAWEAHGALPGGLCDAPAATLAVAPAPRPVEPTAPVLALAAPEPLVAPASLPTDVVAALTVMARFHDADAGPRASEAMQVATLAR